MSELTGPNALVRALRAPQDPPSHGGPSKIQLATSVWQDDTTRIPHKETIIKNWIQESWATADVNDARNSLLNAEYHDLMLPLIAETAFGVPPALLKRLFESLNHHPAMMSHTKHLVWVTGQTDAESPDMWIEAWIAMISAAAASDQTEPVHPRLWQHVEQRLYGATVSGSGARKAPPNLSGLLLHLGQIMQRGEQVSHNVLAAILFPPATLRTGEALQSILSLVPRGRSTLFLLPNLLDSYRQTIYDHRHDIFIQPTSSQSSHDSYLNQKIRDALRKAMSMFKSVYAEISIACSGVEMDIWNSKRNCWDAIAGFGAYLESDEGWSRLLSQDAFCARELLLGPTNAPLAREALAFLAVAETIDHVATAVDIPIYAWCLASTSEMRSAALALLINTLRYHQLSQTVVQWFDNVLDGLQHLVNATRGDRAMQEIHRLLDQGPLWDATSAQIAVGPKPKQAIGIMLLRRTRSLPVAQASVAITLWTIARMTDFVLPLDNGLHVDLHHAMEVVRQSLPREQRQAKAWLHHLALAAVIRVGRTCGAEVRGKLGSRHDFSSSIGQADIQPELRGEICLWAIAQLADGTCASDILPAYLVPQSSDSSAASLNLWTDPECAAILHHYASASQVDSVLNPLMSRKDPLQPSSLPAELLELPGLTSTLLAIAARMLPVPSYLDAAARLILSLPSAVIDQKRRLLLISIVTQVDQHGDVVAKQTTRLLLAHLLKGFTGEIEQTSWTFMQGDLEHPLLGECTSEALRSIITISLDHGSAENVVDSLKDDVAMMLGAEVVVQRDFSQINSPTQTACARLLERLKDLSGVSTSARQVIAVLRLQTWCGMDNCDCSWDAARPGSLVDACEISRLSCHNVAERVYYLRRLASNSHLLPNGTLEAETAALLKDNESFDAVLSACLSVAKNRQLVGPALAMLSVVFSHREEGSGKSILRMRDSIARLLFDSRGSCDTSLARLQAIRAFVKYRSKMLRVCDAARTLDHASRNRTTEAIEIAASITASRPELVLCLIPQMTQLVCRQLAPIHEDTVIDLTSLLTVLCQQRRRDATGRANQLSTAMGKHAPAVLRAYVRGLADTRTELSVSARRHLQTGMYLLCDLVVRAQHRGREGEGIGLAYGVGECGDVEKDLWATLWTQWSRQRYKGQG